jgi:hypothetical protein
MLLDISPMFGGMGQRNNENKLLEEVGRVVLSTKDKVETW